MEPTQLLSIRQTEGQSRELIAFVSRQNPLTPRLVAAACKLNLEKHKRSPRGIVAVEKDTGIIKLRFVIWGNHRKARFGVGYRRVCARFHHASTLLDDRRQIVTTRFLLIAFKYSCITTSVACPATNRNRCPQP